MPALESLLDGLIDYAGLYPPASLDMQAMVDRYAQGIASEEAWMVGRVIVPASGLDAFEEAAAGLLPGHVDDEPWCISALVRSDHLEDDLERIAIFNDAHADGQAGAALIDAIEVKASDPAGIEAIAAALPDGLFAFVEVPVDSDPRGLLAALAGDGLAAKIRTGGIEANFYPDVGDVASFIVHAAAAEVPFKATAGMHHPLPNDNAAVGARQLGFVNVFLGASLVQHAGLDAEALSGVLTLDDPAAFAFDGAIARVGDFEIDAAAIEESRLTFCSSFGSCSLDEPRDDLLALGWLEVDPCPGVDA